MLTWSRRALEYLPPDNLPFRFTAYWTLSFACLLQGDRAAAKQACLEGLAISQKSGDVFSTVLASASRENYRYSTTSSFRRLKPIGVYCRCLATIRSQMPAKCIWPWLASITNGTAGNG